MNSLLSITIPLDYVKEGLQLIIEPRTANSLYDLGEHAIETNEARFQLMEGCYYDYEFTDRDFSFGEIAGHIIQAHKRNKHLGTLSPNIYVGTLTLPIKSTAYIEIEATVELEVQSVKSNYRDDYRDMLALITEKCTDLLLQANSPVSHYFDVDYTKNSQTLYQKFTFIKSVIGTDEFAEAIHRIVSSPVTQWAESIEAKDIRNTRRFSNTTIKEFIKGGNRTTLPKGHYLKKYGLQTLPERVTSVTKIDSIDTPENRFVKHALEVFLRFCTEINSKSKKGSNLYNESILLVRDIESQLQHSIFKDISKATTLKLNSPILQRKEGYREVLRVWLMFDLAAKLIWKGGEDVYGAGKKDIATLYEYWLFFKLLELFQSLFHIDPLEVSNLINETPDGLNLQIKQGRYTALSGVYDTGSRKLNIRFNYNRSFSGKKNYPDSGSWTTTLRPDYTLSFWPYGISENEAEKQELIVHIHFDAKYKVDNFIDLIEQSTEQELDKEKTENRKGNYKNADLLKMHAYKDAIRRTGGAYVLYPGDISTKRRGFHEIIPGLGAFPVRPSKNDSGIGELKSFILEIIEHFVNRASQRERIAFRTYDVYKSEPNKDNEVNEALPETFGENRSLLPDDTFVLVGFYKMENLDWIIKSGLYNARADSKRGSLKLGPGEAGAKYLLLHSYGETIASRLLKIIETGPRVFSKQTLIDKGYPSEPSQDYYLVYKVQEISDIELQNQKWDITKLDKYKKGRGSALPFSVTLTELMKTKVKN